MRGETGQRGAHQHRLVSRDPPDKIVFVPVTVGVFDGDLRLADAAQTVQRVRYDGGDLGHDTVAQLFEKTFTTGEVSVLLRHLAPDLGHPSRCPGCL